LPVLGELAYLVGLDGREAATLRRLPISALEWSTQAMAPNVLSMRPLYLQVRDALAERIAKGEWKPGAAIANEGDLAREFGVSSGTMRKALDLLEGQHLVTRRQGRGTFVNDQSSEDLVLRFTNIRAPNGDRLEGEVRSPKITEGAANGAECARLCLAPGDKVYRIGRIRQKDNKPFMFEGACLPAALFPGLKEKSTLTHSIVSLAQKYGILLGKAEERISVGTTSPDVAAALSMAPGIPVTVLDRVVRAIDGRPVEWRVAWCDLADNHYVALMA
jgi:GntR family transcriptional regulator